MAKASASNPYGIDQTTDRNGVAANNFTAKSSSSKSDSGSSSSSTKSSSSSSSKTGTYDPGKPQGAQMSGVAYDDVPDRDLDSNYYEKEQQYKQQYEDARKNGDWEGMLSANEGMNQVRNDYGLAAQSASQDIQNIKNQSGGSSGGGSGGGSSGVGSGFSDEMKALLDAWRDQAQQQSDAKIDYAVNQAVEELERAKEDAQGQFKEQQEQIALDERQGMDNTALYAELRGDKGGIGKEQYSSVQNTAAQNRLAVSQAQTKLSTDTARQIEDLRAQGEFQKADAALEIAQNYLAQLISLEQWAAEYNLSTAQFQEAVRQWESEFQASMDQFEANLDLSKAELTGAFSDGTPTLSAKNQVTQQLASMGESLLSAGVMPTAEQLSAMGMTEAQAKEYLNILAMEKAQAAAKGSGGTGNGGNLSPGFSAKVYQELYDTGILTEGDAYAALLAAGYSSTEAENIASYYMTWQRDRESERKEQEQEQLRKQWEDEQAAYENATIDNSSVLALGFGPLSSERLAELESQGVIQSYVENGKIKFRRTGSAGSAFPSGGITNGK